MEGQRHGHSDGHHRRRNCVSVRWTIRVWRVGWAAFCGRWIKSRHSSIRGMRRQSLWERCMYVGGSIHRSKPTTVKLSQELIMAIITLSVEDLQLPVFMLISATDIKVNDRDYDNVVLVRCTFWRKAQAAVNKRNVRHCCLLTVVVLPARQPFVWRLPLPCKADETVSSA